MQLAPKHVMSLVSWAAVSAMPAMVSAALSLSISNGTTNNIISPLAGQKLNIISTATGSDAANGIKGLDIYLQVDNGGVDNGNPTDPLVPLITSVDLSPAVPTGIFTGNHTGSGNTGYLLSPNKMLVADSTGTSSGTVSVGTNSVLGVVTFDATNIPPGTYNVFFGNVGSNVSPTSTALYNTFGDISSDYTDASGTQVFFSPNTLDGNGEATYAPQVLTVVAVPEPSVVALAGVAAGCALLRRRRRAMAAR